MALPQVHVMETLFVRSMSWSILCPVTKSLQLLTTGSKVLLSLHSDLQVLEPSTLMV
jgi:hypothetical protein